MQQHPDQLKLEEEPYLKGTVNTVIYHNDTNLYTVLKVKVTETSEAIEDKAVSVTGYFPALQEEETYTFYGKIVTHPKFGLQFQAEHFKKEIPTTKEGIIQYLSSDLFEGIGKKTAEEIVKKLGDSAINKILADASVLYDVPRLSKESRHAGRCIAAASGTGANHDFLESVWFWPAAVYENLSSL